MKMYLIIAVRNLLQARRRTLFLSLALAIVSMLYVILMSLSQGMTETMVKNATTLVSGHVNVGGFYKRRKTDSLPLVNNKSKIRKIIEENTKGVDYITDRDRGWAKVISGTTNTYVSPSGIDLDEEKRFVEVVKLAKESEYVEGGRDQVFGDINDLRKPGNALIFASLAKKLEARVGDTVIVTIESASGRTNTSDLTVVAIAQDRGFMTNWNMFVPKATLHQLYQTKDDVTSVVMIYLKDPSQAEQTMGHLREVFIDKGYRLMDHQPLPFWRKFETVQGEDWTGQKLDLTVWRDEVSYIAEIVDGLGIIAHVLIIILTVIVVVGIINTMLIAVRERTREIGTMRAIGIGRLRVLILFLAEASILGFVATALGSSLGAILAYILDAAQITFASDGVKLVLMSDTLNLIPTWQHGVDAVRAFTIVTALAALWPAYRASKLQPVTAIHSL
jgi:putative ABC transport system permease protein